MDGSDAEVVFGSLDRLFYYPMLDNGQTSASADNLPPLAADQPPHPQVVAPVHIQDPPEPQMLADFVPHPPTEHEIAPFPRLIPGIPVHIQDAPETQMLPAPALPIDEPAHPPHQNAHSDHNQDMLIETNMLQAAYTHPPPPQDQSASNQIMEGSNTHGPAVITFAPTGSEPDHHQPPPQRGAPGQDESKALMLVPANTTPPPTEPRNNDVVIDIGSDSESDNSDEVRILGSFTPLDLPPVTTTPPPITTTTTPSTSRFGESPLLYPVPVSWIHPSPVTTTPPITTTTTTTTPSTSRFGESPLLYPVPVSWIHPSELRLRCDRGETTDDERTETDDDVLPSPSPSPSPAPPQPSPAPLQQSELEEQLARAINNLKYWGKVVNRRTQGKPERPDWLPEDWEMESVTRTGGSSAGNRDKYYIEPGFKGRKFRSKREVLDFLETGKRRQYKRKAKCTAIVPSNVNRPVEGTSSSSWQNLMIVPHLEASTSRQNEETLNLDPDTVPEKQDEETPPNVDSDQDPPKRPRGSPSKEP